MGDEDTSAEAGNEQAKGAPAGSPEDKSWLNSLAEDARVEILKLRGEAKEYRLKRNEYRSEAEINASELKALKEKTAAEEKATLEEKEQFKELYTSEQQQRMTDRQKMIDQEIRIIAKDKGLNDKVALKLIERRGISVDKDGNIDGVERAIERMVEEHEEIFVKKEPEKKAEDKSEDDDDKKKGLKDGDGYKDAKAKKSLGAGQDPKESKDKKKNDLNVRGLPKKEANEIMDRYMANLANK